MGCERGKSCWMKKTVTKVYRAFALSITVLYGDSLFFLRLDSGRGEEKKRNYNLRLMVPNVERSKRAHAGSGYTVAERTLTHIASSI